MGLYNNTKIEIAKAAYNGMTDAQVATALNAPTTKQQPRTIIDSHEIFEAIDSTEDNAQPFTATEREILFGILGMSQVNVGGLNTRTKLSRLFPQATRPVSRAAIIALANQTVPTTIAIELGWPRPVDFGDIVKARANMDTSL